MKKFYSVTFDTIKDHVNRFYAITTSASNKSEAREKAENIFTVTYAKNNRGKAAPHMFHIEVKARASEPDQYIVDKVMHLDWRPVHVYRR